MQIKPIDKEKLLELYKEFNFTSVLGPYKRKDDRWIVILHRMANSELGIRPLAKTVSYPKALMEVHLNRRLLDDETVDHQDRDKTNDEISNLKVLRRSEHSSLDALRVKVHPINCVWCGNIFTPTRHQYSRRNNYKAGPFCSRECSGQYGKKIQNKEITKMGRKPIKIKHYHKKK